MSAAAGNPGGTLMAQQTYVDRQPTYGYDPMTHGGYGAVDDYAPYPHLATTHSQHGGDDYHTMRNSQNPSRQDYCSDPYAAVHKPKKRLDQHLGEYDGRGAGGAFEFIFQCKNRRLKSSSQWRELISGGYNCHSLCQNHAESSMAFK